MTFNEMFILTGIKDQRRKEKIESFFDSPENFIWSYNQMEEDLKKTEINRIKALQSLISQKTYNVVREAQNRITNPIEFCADVLKLNTELLYKSTEELVFALLNHKNVIVKTVVFSTNAPTSVSVGMQQIVRALSMCETATGFISIHNHPSGIVTPSNEDLSSWERFDHVASLLNVRHMDDIIIGKQTNDVAKIYSRMSRDEIEVSI